MLRIRTFGGLSIKRDGETVENFASRKAEALLVYLACNRRSHPREVLAELLWDDRSQRQAMANLRVVLSSLRKKVGSYVEITRTMTSMVPGAAISLDVAELEIVAARMREQNGHLSSDVVQEMVDALAEYEGDFLEGFFIPDASGFEAWASAERERLHRLVLETLKGLCQWHLAQADYAEAIATSSRVLELDPLAEAGHRQLMEALARNGQRNQALAAYEALVETLWHELALEPSGETKELAEAIRADSLEKPLATLAVAQGPRYRLPAAATPLVGRQVELQALDELLLEPYVRLVTILGPGGIGKTRLALALARRETGRRVPGSERLLFPDGVCYVPLAPIATGSQLLTTIAEALDLELEPADALKRSPEKQLCDFLRQKRLLLVLDNFEQLADAAPLLGRMLGAAPELKVLVTSRQRLQLQGEHHFWIQGLEMPQEATGGAAVRSGAVRLFANTAQRVKPTFSMDEDGVATVVRICRLLEGMPLAIELAASWAGVLPLEAIEKEVSRSLDVLAGELRDVPARHRSMQATLETSWQRLGLAERGVFRRFSVFRGGFTLQAAQEVAGATLPMLATLANRSWLTYDPERDRYQIHEILRQFGESRLRKEPDAGRDARAAHAAYYSAFLKQRERGWTGKQQRQLLREIQREADNVRSGWAWSAEQGQTTLLAAGLDSLGAFYERSGYHGEACQLFGATSEALLKSPKPGEDLKRRRLLVRIFSWWSRFTASVEEGMAVLAQAETVLEELKRQAVDVRREEALVAEWKGNTEMLVSPLVARPYFERALSLRRELGDAAGEALALTELGYVEWVLGNLGPAAEMVRQGFAGHRAAGNHSGMARALQSLGLIEKHQGRLVEAEQAHRESYRLFRELGNRPGAASVAADLTMTLVWLGAFEDARSVALEGLQLLQETASPERIGHSSSAAAWAHIHLGRYDEALALEERGLALFRQVGSRQPLGFSLMHLGQLSLVRGAWEEAIDQFEESAAVLRE